MMLRVLIFLAILAVSTLGFIPKAPIRSAAKLEAVKIPHEKIAVATAVIMVNVPLLAQAVEEEYEYGAVDAPIGLAFAAGIAAILTALLPLALRGGEEAFEEIRQRDEGKFGGNNKDVLKRKK